MQYFTFIRTYEVRAESLKDARIQFSRTLEERVEDQYYVGTNLGLTKLRTDASLGTKLKALLPWFLEEAWNQIFGYPKYYSR